MVNQYLTKEAGAYNGVKIASSPNAAGRAGQLHAKKKKKTKNTPDPQITPYTRINSKWIKT